jgi:hypothetical protein
MTAIPVIVVVNSGKLRRQSGAVARGGTGHERRALCQAARRSVNRPAVC